MSQTLPAVFRRRTQVHGWTRGEYRGKSISFVYHCNCVNGGYFPPKVSADISGGKNSFWRSWKGKQSRVSLRNSSLKSRVCLLNTAPRPPEMYRGRIMQTLSLPYNKLNLYWSKLWRNIKGINHIVSTNKRRRTRAYRYTRRNHSRSDSITKCKRINNIFRSLASTTGATIRAAHDSCINWTYNRTCGGSHCIFDSRLHIYFSPL